MNKNKNGLDSQKPDFYKYQLINMTQYKKNESVNC